NDAQRILRALEVLEASGKPISHWQAQKGRSLVHPEDAECLVIEPERAELARRIEQRIAGMIRQGAMEEVRELLALELSPDMSAMKAIGVRELADVDAGRI